jgi:energy-converting hydrogenase Eha subunit A
MVAIATRVSHTGISGGPLLKIRERIGRRKAAVFPEPVCAQAITSLLATMMGIANF